MDQDKTGPISFPSTLANLARKQALSKSGAVESRMLSVVFYLRATRNRPETPFEKIMDEDEGREMGTPVRDQLPPPSGAGGRADRTSSTR